MFYLWFGFPRNLANFSIFTRVVSNFLPQKARGLNHVAATTVLSSRVPRQDFAMANMRPGSHIQQCECWKNHGVIPSTFVYLMPVL